MQQDPGVLLLYSVCLYDTKVMNKYTDESGDNAKHKQDKPGVVLVKNKGKKRHERGEYPYCLHDPVQRYPGPDHQMVYVCLVRFKGMFPVHGPYSKDP